MKIIASATKPHFAPKINSKFFYIRLAVIQLNKAKKADSLNDIVKCVNNIVTIHKNVLELIKQLESQKKWDLLQDKPDYYNLQDTIKGIYKDVKDFYHDMHWDLHGFNSY